MSNFIYPHCQQIIDDGSDVFTSNREIELEKKLEIAVKALKEVIKENEGCMDCVASLPAEKALAKIKEIK